MIKVLVSGSRNHLNSYGVIKYLEDWIKDQDDDKFSMIHGDCPHRRVSKNMTMGKSVDWIARDVFQKYGKVQGIPANWSLGKAGEIIRNQKMVNMKPDVVIAFPYGLSPRTKNCIDFARKAEIKSIIVVDYSELETDPLLPY